MPFDPCSSHWRETAVCHDSNLSIEAKGLLLSLGLSRALS